MLFYRVYYFPVWFSSEPGCLGVCVRMGELASEGSLRMRGGAEEGAKDDAAATGGQRFTKRSDSAIQRSYDAAAGPPTKADAQQVCPA